MRRIRERKTVIFPAGNFRSPKLCDSRSSLWSYSSPGRVSFAELPTVDTLRTGQHCIAGVQLCETLYVTGSFLVGICTQLGPDLYVAGDSGYGVYQGSDGRGPSDRVGLAVMFWVAGFDMIYACQDAEFDREAKLSSIPSRLGVGGALRLASFCHALMVGLLVLLPLLHFWVGSNLGLGWIYWLSIATVAGLLVYEHLLVRPDDLTRVNAAFFNVNAIVSIGLFITTTIDLLVI
jgi:hypothetical protein